MAYRRAGRILEGRTYDSTDMNSLKRARIVTLAAGSALILATTAAVAAPASVGDETGQVSQTGVQGQSGELDRNSNEQTGDQATSGDGAHDQTGVEGQSGELDRNSNSQSGTDGTSGDGANGQGGIDGQSGQTGA
jgi:hypothetical protein